MGNSSQKGFCEYEIIQQKCDFGLQTVIVISVKRLFYDEYVAGRLILALQH